MAHAQLESPLGSHDVTNQPPPLLPFDLYSTDRALHEAVGREGAAWADDRLRKFGAVIGDDVVTWATQANTFTPVHRSHDRYGYRVDEVEFHPAWHELMRTSIENEIHALPWREPRPGAHVARAAQFFMMSQIEAGHGCPISMTYAVIPALRHQPEIAAIWEPRFTANEYDPRQLPAAHKRGSICGMAMTEKQGGSDVRANTTRATPLGKGGPGGAYAITGHKWFCSAPQSDGFLILAYTDKGLSCFLVPRWLDDGPRNRIFIQRLKDKLGNRSNASSEIELVGAHGWMIGEEGRGVPTIIEMVNHTRLDCVIGSASGMRQAVAQAIHHAQHREAFGKTLVDQPLMRNVLADLCIESEAATVAMMRLARSYDESVAGDEHRLFQRLATAVMKYWVCKRYPMLAAEAMECLGGAGYVEEAFMPRLYREAPVNSIWEGSGNVICLDVLRAIGRQPESLHVFFDEVDAECRTEPRLGKLRDDVSAQLTDFTHAEAGARRLVERLAVLLQGALLVRHSPSFVSEAFLATRVGRDTGSAFGTLPRGLDDVAIIARSAPTAG